MTDFNYVAKQSVRAAQWRGDNLEELRELLKGVIDEDPNNIPYVYAEWVEPFFYTGLNFNLSHEGYYILQTENDEFDPGIWIVVYDDGEIEGMDDEEFNKMFKKV